MANTIKVDIVGDSSQFNATFTQANTTINNFTQNVRRSGTTLNDVFRGNLLANYFQRGASAAIDFGKESIGAYKEAISAQRVLSAEATRAGVAYDVLAIKAKAFARITGQSDTDAQKTFAEITRLASLAGRTKDVDVIAKGFADLGAARGIDSSKLAELANQIASGITDESLNKFGIDDPGKLYANFARQAGKTAESLTEVEKAQARVNAILEKSAIFGGTAEEKLKGLDGQLEQLNSNWVNFKTGVGGAIASSMEFQDLIKTLNDALKELGGNVDDVKRKLKGGKDPKQLAEEEANSYKNLYIDTVKDVLTAIPATALIPVDLVTEGTDVAKERFIESVTGAHRRRVQFLEEQYRAQLGLDAKQEESAKQQDEFLKLQEATQKRFQQVQLQRKETIENSKSIDNAFQLSQAKTLLQSLKAESVFNKKQGVIDPELDKQIKDFTKTIVDAQKRINQAAQQIFKDVRSSFVDAFESLDKDNPFTKIFLQIETASERARERFGQFGKDFAEKMAEVERATLKAELAQARYNARLDALKASQEIARLSLPFIGQTGSQERTLNVINARIADALQGEQFRRTASFVENPYQFQNPRRDFIEQFDKLFNLSTEGAGRSGNEAKAKAILEFLQAQGITPQQIVNSSDPFVVQRVKPAFVQANRTLADSFSSNIADELARQQAGNLIQQQALQQLAEINKSGLSDAARVKEFLAVTGSLDQKELTGDLRTARVEALKESERLSLDKEARSEAQIKAIKDVLGEIKTVLADKGIKISADNPALVEVTITDESATVTRLGSAPNADDTANAFN